MPQNKIWRDRELKAKCTEIGENRIQHISTEYYIQDIERLRRLLGEDKIHFIGISYGGTLGMRYAIKYKDKIGRLVLDSPSAEMMLPNNQLKNKSLEQVLYDISSEHFKKELSGF